MTGASSGAPQCLQKWVPAMQWPWHRAQTTKRAATGLEAMSDHGGPDDHARPRGSGRPVADRSGRQSEGGGPGRPPACPGPRGAAPHLGPATCRRSRRKRYSGGFGDWHCGWRRARPEEGAPGLPGRDLEHRRKFGGELGLGPADARATQTSGLVATPAADWGTPWGAEGEHGSGRACPAAGGRGARRGAATPGVGGGVRRRPRGGGAWGRARHRDGVPGVHGHAVGRRGCHAAVPLEPPAAILTEGQVVGVLAAAHVADHGARGPRSGCRVKYAVAEAERNTPAPR